MKRYLFISCTLHLVLLMWFLVTVPKEQEEKKPSGGGSGDLKKILEIESADLYDGELAKKEARKNCTPYYGGIGVSIGFDRSITQVHEGYPAAENGIKTGDILLTLDVIGEVGTPVTVKVQRGNQVLTIPMIRGRICLQE